MKPAKAALIQMNRIRKSNNSVNNKSPNWVRDNPTRSLIIYTLTILAASFAAFKFTLDENKETLHQNVVSLKQVQIERLNLDVEQHVRRIESLEKESIMWEDKYNNLEERLSGNSKLETNILEENNQLRTEVKNLKERNKTNLVNSSKYEASSGTLKLGSSFRDKKTGATFGISSLNTSNQASGVAILPNGKKYSFENITPGYNWQFNFSDKEYTLTYKQGQYVRSLYSVMVNEK